MADDLVERLRFCANLHPQCGYPENGKLFGAAADRITALQAQNRKLVEALTKINVGEGWAAQIARAAVVQALEMAATVDWSKGRDVTDNAPDFLTDWQRGLVAGQAAMKEAFKGITADDVLRKIGGA